MSAILYLKNSSCKVAIENGAFIRFKGKEVAFIHQKRGAGWRNSDLEMFSVIDPISKNSFSFEIKIL